VLRAVREREGGGGARVDRRAGGAVALVRELADDDARGVRGGGAGDRDGPGRDEGPGDAGGERAPVPEGGRGRLVEGDGADRGGAGAPPEAARGGAAPEDDGAGRGGHGGPLSRPPRPGGRASLAFRAGWRSPVMRIAMVCHAFLPEGTGGVEL